jgi:succinyl-diaminopimelate desuccinylase
VPVPVEVDGLTYHDVVTITEIRGGIAHNVVPDRVELWVNVRVAPGNAIEHAQREVEELAGPAATVTWVDTAPPAHPRVSDPAVQGFIERTGLTVLPKQAWTDVATLQAWGVPAFNYGPGNPTQAHQPGEWVEISRLKECERVLAAELGA